MEPGRIHLYSLNVLAERRRKRRKNDCWRQQLIGFKDFGVTWPLWREGVALWLRREVLWGEIVKFKRKVKFNFKWWTPRLRFIIHRTRTATDTWFHQRETLLLLSIAQELGCTRGVASFVNKVVKLNRQWRRAFNGIVDEYLMIEQQQMVNYFWPKIRVLRAEYWVEGGGG